MIGQKMIRNSCVKYFHPRVNKTNYNVLINGSIFHDLPVRDQIKKNDEIKKMQQDKEMITQEDIC